MKTGSLLVFAGGAGSPFALLHEERVLRAAKGDYGILPGNELIDLPERGFRPMVVSANKVARICGDFGGKQERQAWIKTPFILERANPSQGGDAKPWALVLGQT